MLRTYSQKQRRYKYSQHSSIIWPIWLNNSVFLYKLSGCWFRSSCSHSDVKFCASFEQEVSWHSGNYRMWIDSEKCKSHDKNIHSIVTYIFQLTIKLDHLANLLNISVFLNEVSANRFKSCCMLLNVRFFAGFEQRFPWHSGNCRLKNNS